MAVDFSFPTGKVARSDGWVPRRLGTLAGMEQTETPEGLVRRTLVKDDGRFLNFYNTPGEMQPINPDAEHTQASHAEGLASTDQPGPIAGAAESGGAAFNANVGKGA